MLCFSTDPMASWMQMQEHALERLLLPLSGLTSWLIVLAGGLSLLHVLGINVAPLLTVGGVSGILVGLSAQSVMANMIAGINLVRLLSLHHCPLMHAVCIYLYEDQFRGMLSEYNTHMHSCPLCGCSCTDPTCPSLHYAQLRYGLAAVCMLHASSPPRDSQADTRHSASAV